MVKAMCAALCQGTADSLCHLLRQNWQAAAAWATRAVLVGQAEPCILSVMSTLGQHGVGTAWELNPIHLVGTGSC